MSVRVSVVLFYLFYFLSNRSLGLQRYKLAKVCRYGILYILITCVWNVRLLCVNVYFSIL